MPNNRAPLHWPVLAARYEEWRISGWLVAIRVVICLSCVIRWRPPGADLATPVSIEGTGDRSRRRFGHLVVLGRLASNAISRTSMAADSKECNSDFQGCVVLGNFLDGRRQISISGQWVCR